MNSSARTVHVGFALLEAGTRVDDPVVEALVSLCAVSPQRIVLDADGAGDRVARPARAVVVKALALEVPRPLQLALQQQQQQVSVCPSARSDGRQTPSLTWT